MCAQRGARSPRPRGICGCRNARGIVRDLAPTRAGRARARCSGELILCGSAYVVRLARPSRGGPLRHAPGRCPRPAGARYIWVGGHGAVAVCPQRVRGAWWFAALRSADSIAAVAPGFAWEMPQSTVRGGHPETRWLSAVSRAFPAQEHVSKPKICNLGSVM